MLMDKTLSTFFHLPQYISYFRFAQNFIDIRERESNEIPRTQDGARNLMNLHNNEAGRRVNIGIIVLTLLCISGEHSPHYLSSTSTKI